MGSPERKGFIDSGAEYHLDMLSAEDLKLLLTEEEAWKQLVEGAGLSREEEASLHEALAEVFANADEEDVDMLQNGLQDKTGRYSAPDSVKLFICSWEEKKEQLWGCLQELEWHSGQAIEMCFSEHLTQGVS
ncbi:apolipoprotein L2-like [Sigmodon hispidus]